MSDLTVADLAGAVVTQVRSRGRRRLLVCCALALAVALLAAGRSFLLPFAQSVTIELGPLTCFAWIPLWQTFCSPRGWPLEAGYARWGWARASTLGMVLVLVGVAAAALAHRDLTLTPGVAARNALLVGALMILLSRIVASDAAALTCLGIVTMLLMAGKNDVNEVRGWALFLQPGSAVTPWVVTAAAVVGALAWEAQPLRGAAT